MSGFFRPRNLIIAGGVGVGAFLFSRTSSRGNPIPNVFDTPGSQNIGNRYSAGGGSTTHLPGVATPRGNSANTVSNQMNSTGAGTPAFDERHADQKRGDPGVVGKAFHQAHLGNDKGK